MFVRRRRQSTHIVIDESQSSTTAMSAVEEQKKSSTIVPQQPQEKKKACCTIPILVIFSLQLLVSVAAFVGITVMFVVTSNEQLDNDVNAIAQVNLKYINASINGPVQEFMISSVVLGDLVKTNAASYSDALMSNMSDPNQHRVQFAMYRGAAFQERYYGGIYQLYDTGVASAINPAVNAVTESRCDSQTCRITDAAGLQVSWYMPAAVPNDPATFSFTTPLATSSNVVLAAESYVYAALRLTNTSTELWTPPYVTLYAGYVFVVVSYMRCLVDNPSTGGCRLAVVRDVNFGFVSLIIGQFVSTPTSIVSMVDLRSMKLLATSDSITLLNGTQPWPAANSPSARTNDAVTRFLAYCPSLTACPAMVQKSDDKIFSVVQVAPVNGINFAVIDVADRSYYYDTADKTLRIAIAVVVVVSCVAIVTSVLTFLGISTPISALMEGFALASILRNEEVVSTSSAITEIQVLSENFDVMNAKLLAARAYMPQSMLNTGNEDDEDDEDEGDANLHAEQSAGSHHNSSAPPLKQQRRGSMMSVASRMSKSKTIAAKASEGLSEKKCSVLIVNIVGLHGSIVAWDPSRVSREFGKWVQMLQTVAKQERAVIDVFHGDRIVLTFNSSNSVASHAKRAALCALALEQQTQSTAFPVLSMGMATGKALSGSAGSSSLRAFVTLGPIYSHAAVLERSAQRMASRDKTTTILATEACHDEVSFAAYTYPVGRHPAIDGAKVLCVAAALERGATDEWLYELHDANSSNPFSVINKAMALIVGESATPSAAALSAANDCLTQQKEMLAKLTVSEHVRRALDVATGLVTRIVQEKSNEYIMN